MTQSAQCQQSPAAPGPASRSADASQKPSFTVQENPRLDRTLTYRLHVLNKLADLESQHEFPRRVGMSPGDARCLATVASFEPLSVKDLAEQSNLTKGQASRAAQALVDRGLVHKCCSAEDGRGVVLTLTPEGRVASEQVMAFIHERNHRIFGCLEPGEQSVFSQLLDRLIQHNRLL